MTFFLSACFCDDLPPVAYDQSLLLAVNEYSYKNNYAIEKHSSQCQCGMDYSRSTVPSLRTAHEPYRR